MKDLSKKMRLQLFDKEFNQIADRLVTQDIELRSGPKEIHKGPLKVEVSLFEKGDVDNFITYLKKVQGDLPLESVKKLKKTLITSETMDDSDRDKLVEYCLSLPSQDEIIFHLRKNNFKFLTWDHIQSLELDLNFISEKHQEKYQFMLRLSKETKNPLTCKYDPIIVFGFKLMGDKIENFVVYLYQKLHKVGKLPWTDANKVSFKQQNLIKFPHYMIQEEKDKFRVELNKLKLKPELMPSKFFMRWIKDTDFKDKQEILKRNKTNE